ncbi:hypothetical protein QQ045_030526 [Rhodiola kirilowii]
MVLASLDKVILGSIAFAFFWTLAVFPAVPVLPIGRTAGSILAAVLMVVFRVVTPDEAYAAVDLSILGLLFGTMLVSNYLEQADMFKYLGNVLSWKSKGPKDMLCRICIVAAISSALFTNDTCCVVLTEFVMRIAAENKVPAHPFLLALASSANIGSSATPIGNPQNLVIAIQSKISFGEFLVGVLPAMLVGILVNTLFLLCTFWKALSVKIEPLPIVSPMSQTHENLTKGANAHSVNIELIVANNLKETKIGNIAESDDEVAKGKKLKLDQRKMFLSKLSVYLVTLGMLVALLKGLNMSWTTLTAAFTLVVLDFKDARPCLDKVSYSLLVFFCGMFITVDGFNATGIPSTLWNLMEPFSRINHTSGIAVLAVVVLVLSNIASNVPTVLLLGARVAASAAAISDNDVKKAWLILAWVSTVAGNLSLLGSAANMIVCEQAQHSKELGYNLSFWQHLKFGFPSTIVITAIGLTLIRA